MKNYNDWHKRKTDIENHSNEKLFRERDVWWCSLGQNIGFEQDGKNKKFERPVLVLKKFNKAIYLGVPLTTKKKENKFHFKIAITNKDSFAILSQIRLLSSKRLIRRIERINKTSVEQVRDKVIGVIESGSSSP